MKRTCCCTSVPFTDEAQPAGSGIARRTPTARPALRQVQNVPVKRPPSAVPSKKLRLEPATASVQTQTSLLNPTKKHDEIPLPAAAQNGSNPVIPEVKISETTFTDGAKTTTTPTETTSSKVLTSIKGTLSCDLIQTVGPASASSTARKSRVVQFRKSTDSSTNPEHLLVDDNLILGSAIKLLEEYRKRRQDKITVSPIPPNASLGTNILLARYSEEPARKKTLMKAKRRRDEYSPYTGDIFNLEYVSENLAASFKIDQLYIGKRGFLNAHNSHLSGAHRTKILEWILIIADDIRLSKRVYFMFVRLLDNILENMHVPRNMAQLVAIVTCWIMMKMHEISVPGAKKLAALCANTYTVKQILQMEMKLLVYTQFNLLISTPSDFYFPLEIGDNNEQLLQCIQYILEQFTYDLRFSQYSSAELATAATYLAAHCLQIDGQSIRKFKTLDSVRELVFLMDVQMNKIISAQSSSNDKQKVCKKLLQYYRKIQLTEREFYY